MEAEKHLLSDAEMQQFIAQGYVQVQANFPGDFHAEVCRQIDAVLEAEGNPGNNIAPRIPAIAEVFAHPAVRGALTSILGAGYLMHPHRYCHLNSPGSDGQSWHKDDYIFDQNIRYHRCRWVMAFYYPQDVAPDMGPTGVMPGRQWYNGISNADPVRATETELGLCGPAGTVSIVNFDSWHRATANRSDKRRYMLKYQFTRMAEPEAPAWNNKVPHWQSLDGDPHPELSRHVWDWLCGRSAASNGSARWEDLGADSETARLQAAYNLGGDQVEGLIENMQSQAQAQAETNLAHSPTNPQGGNPGELGPVHALAALGVEALDGLLDAAQQGPWPGRAAAMGALATMGKEAAAAVPVLQAALSDDAMWVRRNAAEALGIIGSAAVSTAPDLARAMGDEVELVRRNAAFALSKMAPPDDELVPLVARALADPNRYTRYCASTALRKIGTAQARRALIEALEPARWCAITSSSTNY
ncbi:MAG: HEAT repeat domain-containing protein [Candidatus Latescibacteria bacterium]|nr:HEAT repeat domain-containing protein [Candidatus Latescibacterota bacterium]